jgi:hypothetical protein
MSIASGTKLLRGRYSLIDDKFSASETSESWIAFGGEDERRFLVKLWPYQGDEPPQLLRALWDAELRTLYRVASAPRAEDTILVIRDAGLDRDAKCFVMVLEADNGGGYESLATALSNRQDYAWLQTGQLAKRRDIWGGLGRVAEGIMLLHEQNTLHRNVEAECVFFNRATGIQSLRLGGFEWSIRLGVPETRRPALGWSSPPEFFKDVTFGFRPETDWFAFGMLAARCLRPIENYKSNEPQIRHQRVLKTIDEASATQLSELEKNCLIRLIADDPEERLADPKSILTAIDEIARGLSAPLQPGPRTPLLIGIDPKNHSVVDAALGLGFLPDPSDQEIAFNPLDRIHVSRLCEFLADDINGADPCVRLSSIHNEDFFIVEGNRLILTISEFEYTNKITYKTERTWDVAFCFGAGFLRNKEASSDLIGEKIAIRPVGDLKKQMPLSSGEGWKNLLPRVDPAWVLRADLNRFYNFIRCTNQLELLVRDAEIFAYELFGEPTQEAARLTIKIREVERERTPLELVRIEGGLVEFLQREITSGKLHSRRVILSDSDSLILDEAEKSDDNIWSVEKVDPARQLVTLYRVIDSSYGVACPTRGHIRAWGMFGQISLIRRRKRAIDRIEKHSFLLRSLSSPGYVYMDTGFAPLPRQIPPNKVDDAKRAALEDILRVRPIYALQGPPGTGKTTLVAHLLRQIFSEDPVAQVLITAQAHGAVNVLRDKVRTEAFSDVPDSELPLAVRIGTERNEDHVEGTVAHVAADILDLAGQKLATLSERTTLQEQWLSNVQGMLNALKTGSPWPGLHDFLQIVKRGASITYCTTSAGDLEVLADSVQSFDWAIVEEAGKTYAFDLALPLQMGHRWLLIGDHKQLPPYRFESQLAGISSLDQVVSALDDLWGIGATLKDLDWIKSWGEMSTADQTEFKQYASSWLNAFQRIFSLCSKASGIENITSQKPEGAAAGRLTEQHRMHPTIGRLISTVFYDGELADSPELEPGGTRHRAVTHRLTGPESAIGRSIIWLNTVWAVKDPKYSERGRRESAPPYSNPGEADALLNFIQKFNIDSMEDPEKTEIAILAPYTQQVALINDEARKYQIPPFLTLKNFAGRAVPSQLQLAHTVDSFQGNQADIVCISLVRNNRSLPGEGFGFLKERPRLNVLLSRAKQLLVLVGSWEFFEYQVKEVSLRDNLDPLWHWKKTMSLLHEWFNDGLATRLDVM